MRLYSPVTGRFLSVDPVDGGSASAYDYCNADPVNCTDLAGTWSFKSVMKVVAEVASVASIIPGPIGMAAAGVSAVAYAASGDLVNAAIMTAGIALAAVGAGAAVVAAKGLATSVKVGTAIAKAAPKAERAFNAVKTVASKVKPALNRVAQVVRRSGCGNSFVAGTPVLLADGSQVPIEDVAVGDVVISTDPATGVTGPGVVTDLIRHLQVHAWVAVQVVTDAGVQTIDATAEHPFFVVSAAGVTVPADAGVAGFWIDAADLVVGDVVSTADGGTGIVSAVTTVPTTFAGDTWAYNLTIQGTHTYYVGDQPVLVHNALDACGLPELTKGQPRLEGDLPSRIPTHVSIADLRIAERKLTTSISSRLGAAPKLDRGHAKRVQLERRLLEQVRQRMRAWS